MRWEDRLLVYYVLMFMSFFGFWLEGLGGFLSTIGVWLLTIGFLGLVVSAVHDLYKVFKATNDRRRKRKTEGEPTSLKKLDQMVGGFLFSFFIMILVSFPLAISIIGGVGTSRLNWYLIIGIETLLFFVANTYTYRHFANEYIKKGMRIAYAVFIAFVVVSSSLFALLLLLIFFFSFSFFFFSSSEFV